HVVPRVLAQALARAATDLGAVVLEGASVDRLLTQGDRVVGVALGGETILSPETIVATGAWASAWSDALRTPIPVRPVRGQTVARMGRDRPRHRSLPRRHPAGPHHR